MRKLISILLVALIAHFGSCMMLQEQAEEQQRSEAQAAAEETDVVFPAGKAESEFSDVVDLSAEPSGQSIEELLGVTEPSATPTVIQTEAPKPSPTVQQEAVLKVTPTPTPKPTEVLAPTIVPTPIQTETPKPTAIPTLIPTPNPTSEPIPEPEPTAEEMQVLGGGFNSAVLAAVNETRALYGNELLVLDGGLCGRSLAHAKEMALQGKLFHACGGAESVSDFKGSGSTIGTRAAAHATGLALDADRSRLGVGSVIYGGVQYTCVFAPRD